MDDKKNNNKKGLKIFAYSLLCLASLTAIALSICNLTGYTTLVGEKGDKGSKGETGDKGLTGDQGSPGEKGDKGETGDKGSIGETGDQGEKGDKGETGDKGSKGDKGNTGPIGDKGNDGLNGKDSDKYYNSIILESKGGHITLDKGCAKVGETVTFTIIPDDNYIFNKLTINSKEVLTNTDYTSGNFVKGYEMVEEGLVVSASFISTTEYPVLDLANGGELYQSISKVLPTDSEGNVYNLKLIGNLTETSTINLSHYLNLDLNGKTLNINNIHNGFYVNKGYSITIDDSSEKKNGKINVVGIGDNGDSAIQLASGSSTTEPGGKLELKNAEIKIDGKNTSSNNRCYAINAGEYSVITVTGGKITSTQDDDSKAYTQTIYAPDTATLSISNATISATSTNTYSSTIGGTVKPTITSSTFNGYTSFTGVGGTITNCTFNGKVGTSSSVDNVMALENCTLNSNYEYVQTGTGDKQNGKLINCVIEGEVIECADRVISGLESKFKCKFETTSWLAEGYSFSATTDSDGYYHLVESTTNQP